MNYKDYYKVLGIPRTATTAEVTTAYRQLARKYHPDRNPDDKASEEKFKEITEAYEVIKDPQSRKKYDQLGQYWKGNRSWSPPSGFGGQPFGGSFAGGSGFSDFFEFFFGGRGGNPGSAGPQADPFEAFFSNRPAPPRDYTAEITLPLSYAYHGGNSTIRLANETGATKNVTFRMPKGIQPGGKIRMRGKAPGGGDLFLKVSYACPQGTYLEDGHLTMDLPITPWEAALGAKLAIDLPSGDRVNLQIPVGANSATKLRLKGKGIPSRDGASEMYIELQIHTPKKLSRKERKLIEELASTSTFDPRR